MPSSSSIEDMLLSPSSVDEVVWYPLNVHLLVETGDGVYEGFHLVDDGEDLNQKLALMWALLHIDGSARCTTAGLVLKHGDFLNKIAGYFVTREDKLVQPCEEVEAVWPSLPSAADKLNQEPLPRELFVLLESMMLLTWATPETLLLYDVHEAVTQFFKKDNYKPVAMDILIRTLDMESLLEKVGALFHRVSISEDLPTKVEMTGMRQFVQYNVDFDDFSKMHVIYPREGGFEMYHRIGEIRLVIPNRSLNLECFINNAGRALLKWDTETTRIVNVTEDLHASMRAIVGEDIDIRRKRVLSDVLMREVFLPFSKEHFWQSFFAQKARAVRMWIASFSKPTRFSTRLTKQQDVA